MERGDTVIICPVFWILIPGLLLFFIFSSCAAWLQPCRDGLLLYDERVTLVSDADSIWVSPDGKTLSILVPNNHRLVRGWWVFPLPPGFTIPVNKETKP